MSSSKKTMYDASREDRKDWRTISNAGAVSMTLTDNDFEVRGLNGLSYDFDGAGLTTLTLPVAKVGYRIICKVSGTGGVRITPGTGDALSNGAGVGTVNKYLGSTTNGALIVLDCTRAGVWDCLVAIGTWTFQS